jgi:hypothetical protein
MRRKVIVWRYRTCAWDFLFSLRKLRGKLMKFSPNFFFFVCGRFSTCLMRKKYFVWKHKTWIISRMSRAYGLWWKFHNFFLFRLRFDLSFKFTFCDQELKNINLKRFKKSVINFDKFCRFWPFFPPFNMYSLSIKRGKFKKKIKTFNSMITSSTF